MQNCAIREGKRSIPIGCQDLQASNRMTAETFCKPG
jgi:hypothetical protein